MVKVKSTLLVTILAFGIVFILFQIYIITSAWMKFDDLHSEKSKKKRKLDGWNPPHQYLVVQVFTEQASKHHIPLFLIEPAILESVWAHRTGKRIAVGECRFLCGRRNATAFGVISNEWITQEFLDALHSKGFKWSSIQSRDPRLIAVNTPSAPTIDGHRLFTLHGHVIHLVVFYERAGSYLWHSRISWVSDQDSNSNDKEGLNNFSFKSLPFGGKNAGSYKKMEFTDIRIDGVSLTVPKYPMPFLRQSATARHLECNYHQAEGFLSEYGVDDSPEAAAFRARAKDILARGAKALDRLGVPFWLSSGTCLGWFRECNIIAHSIDVDLGMKIRDYNNKVIPAMESQGLQLLHLFGKKEDSFELSFARDSIKLDIFFFYEEEDYIWNGGTDANTGEKFQYVFPLFDLCWTELVGLRLRVPCPTLPYVEANYGDEWNRKVTEWDWKESPPNARPNGRWPQEEWGNVMQTFPIM